MTIRDGRTADRDQIARFLLDSWGSSIIVSKGRAHDASNLAAKVAIRREALVGLATFRLEGNECELVTLDCVEQRKGIGSDLLLAVINEARVRGARRVWLITSNDNLDALRFYQRRGLRLAAIHRGAIDQARQIKPSIPYVGSFGIAIHDELELEVLIEHRAD